MSAWVRRQAQRPRRCAAAARLERTRQRRVCLCACLVAWMLGGCVSRGDCGLMRFIRQGLRALVHASCVRQGPTRATLVGLQLDGGCMQLL